MQGSGHLFGPGLPGTGTLVTFTLEAFGLHFDAPASATPAPPPVSWQAVNWRRGGFNNSQLLLEWRDDTGHYSLSVADIAVQAALLPHLQAGTREEKRRVPGTRRWIGTLVGVFVGLPLLALILLFTQAGKITEWAVGKIPIETEKKLGAQAFAQYRLSAPLVEQHPALPMLRELGKRLTAGSSYQYEIHVARDATVNAFAMPGGYIVFHTALLEKAGRAEEVAGVLAHEIQHVELRHGLRGMVHAAGWRIALTLLMGDTGGTVAASLVENLGNLRFSRSQESEADMRGVKALLAADIDPRGMAEFFRKLAKQGGSPPALLSSHPASEDRFVAVEQAVPTGRQFPPLPYDLDEMKSP